MKNNKENFDFYVKNGILKADDDLPRITSLVNLLIAALYIPVTDEHVTKTDPARFKKFHIEDGEPINWGDLKCNEVKRVYGEHGIIDGYEVIIDEADPQGCETFCNYIEDYMEKWGWSVKVITEW